MKRSDTLAGPPPPTPAELAQIARIAHDEAGLVIGPSKTTLVQSRLARRLRALDLPDYGRYLALVTAPEGQDERRRMISALTTNVSQFFREPHHFALLRDRVLPPLVARARSGGRIRIWSAGCAAGQEAFSIAATLAGLLPDPDRHDIRILATDIDPHVLALARAASYDAADLAPVPPDLRRWFETTDGGAGPGRSLREIVSFRELNLHAPWPMAGRFDVIFCRNVTIYFDVEAQHRLWQRFATALSPEGWLFIGHSERIPAGLPFHSVGVTAYRLSGAAGQTPCR
ncbi:CheR family methyltransferase [Frigidibacter oleivorans]|uniref:CheR family methyltransferase n=1 Tax=Frigidibacter oleivorans TaxID=2487129 RepID=UPI000F8DC95A|nr:protein-glutamate O-methyltransferase [Frigidibacter oleivorans]